MTDANFGSRFGWYVDNINRKMDANGYRSLVDPHTPTGATRLHRRSRSPATDRVSDVRLDRTSGSPDVGHGLRARRTAR